MPDSAKSPPHIPKAAALTYEQGSDGAPKLAAKGRGYVAEKIIALARQHNIPIREDADLVELLEKVEVEQEIPIELYAVVAEIFSYIYAQNAKRKGVISR